MSRLKRWADATQKAIEAIEDILEIQQEYEDWKESLPENLESSTLGEKLEEVCEMDIEEAKGLIEDAQSLDLPRGFGRD